MAGQGPEALCAVWTGPSLAATSWLENGLLPSWRSAPTMQRIDRFHAEGGDGILIVGSMADAASAQSLASGVDVPRAVDADVVPFAHGMSNLNGTSGAFHDAPYMFTVRVFPPAKQSDALRAWLHEEHFLRQTTTPGLTWAHGYEALSGPFHFLNLWGVDDPDLPDSPRYLEIRDTPWYAEVVPIFQGSNVRRAVYRLLTSEEVKR